ncbi:hypothetical protein F5Y14DRAFT_437265 [Nemania sp. NC0429]|nr:hypothetical protein F5Y14DRAFT_437265 [Nemania sp. NC0429]
MKPSVPSLCPSSRPRRGRGVLSLSLVQIDFSLKLFFFSVVDFGRMIQEHYLSISVIVYVICLYVFDLFIRR